MQKYNFFTLESKSPFNTSLKNSAKASARLISKAQPVSTSSMSKAINLEGSTMLSKSPSRNLSCMFSATLASILSRFLPNSSNSFSCSFFTVRAVFASSAEVGVRLIWYNQSSRYDANFAPRVVSCTSNLSAKKANISSSIGFYASILTEVFLCLKHLECSIKRFGLVRIAFWKA